MFERYTEKARRAVFFARYEASRYGSPTIESEHLLLGLLRENRSLQRWMPHARTKTIRHWIEAETAKGTPISTSVDLPLSDECKKILKAAADEAYGLGHHSIGTDHLFLALFAVKDCMAAKLLQQAGADIETVRGTIPAKAEYEESSLRTSLQKALRLRLHASDYIEIHGARRDADYIRGLVSTIRSYNWHWHKAVFTPRDMVIHRKTGRFSFDLSLADDRENFILVEQGWKKDHCFICRWELHESDNEHGTGYTNGRNWLCIECCERFIQRPDFFSSSHSEMT